MCGYTNFDNNFYNNYDRSTIILVQVNYIFLVLYDVIRCDATISSTKSLTTKLKEYYYNEKYLGKGVYSLSKNKYYVYK